MRSQSNLVCGVNLKQLLPEAQFLNSTELYINSCCGHWEDCRENDLFVALVQADHDGHDDAARAVSRGASSVLGERLLPVDAPQCIVGDSRQAFGRLCHALAGDPSEKMTTIGVAGTDGKTTTAHLIHSILHRHGVSAGLSSSIHAPSSATKSDSPGSKTAPDSHWPATTCPQAAQRISDMLLEGNQYAVLETSSLDLAQHHLAGIQLDTAVLTNLRGNHFDFHGSMANYQTAQRRLLDYLKPTGLAVVNADDPVCGRLLEELDVPTITYGVKNAAEVEARILEQTLDDQTFLISAGSESVTVRTRIPGSHHIYNCLGAAAVALTCGIDQTTIARGLHDVQSLPGRLDLVRCGQVFHVAIDQATTPYRLGVALSTLKRHCRGRIICVFNVPEACSSSVAGQFGRIAERSCHAPIVTLDRTQADTDYDRAHQVLDGFQEAGRARLIPKRIDAIEWALSHAKSGDAVLIAGRGEKPIAAIGGRRWSLTDRDVCEAWLYGEPSSKARCREEREVIFRIDDYRIC